MESGSARPCALVRGRLAVPPPRLPRAPRTAAARRLAARRARRREAPEPRSRGARSAETVAFLCFMENFFFFFLSLSFPASLSLPVAECPSLGQILFMVLEEGWWWSRREGGRGVHCELQAISFSFSFSSYFVSFRRSSVQTWKLQKYRDVKIECFCARLRGGGRREGGGGGGGRGEPD